METNQEYKFAVLIDADNVPHANIKEMLDEISKYGTPTIKRTYGDWANPIVARWKPFLLKNAITPIQQYSYTTGKNATDSAMIIDAMDILHSNKVDGFCLISSDSDFTRLATRIRESGKLVIGMGEKKTPIPFIASCDKFIYIEILRGDEAKLKENNKQSESKPKVEMKEVDLLNLLNQSIDDWADDDGWAFLGNIGNHILKKYPDFDPRNYHYRKLSTLMESFGDYFTIEKRDAYQPVKLVYVKKKAIPTQMDSEISQTTSTNPVESKDDALISPNELQHQELSSDLDCSIYENSDLKEENQQTFTEDEKDF